MMSLKVLALLCACLCLAVSEMEQSSPRAALGTQNAHPLERRYSEGILASDYSRTVDNMLKKNFVDWLLARREKKSDPSQAQSKREAESESPVTTTEEEEGAQTEPQGTKPFFAWLLKNKQKESFPTDVKAILGQRLLNLLISEDICGDRTQ